MKKQICLILVSTLLMILLTACGKEWTCDNCGKEFRGTAYYGYSSTETMCEDCARTYWAPFSYKNFAKK